MRALGGVALLFFAAHAIDLALHGTVLNLIWSCNLAALVVALGLVLRSPTPIAVGGVMLLVLDPLWVIDLASGGEVLLTSPLTHVGTAIFAVVGMRRLGVPRSTWFLAVSLVAVATTLARVVGPARENINLAFAVPPGWEARFPSHAWYMVCLGSLVTVAALAVQLGLRRLGFHPPGDSRRMSP